MEGKCSICGCTDKDACLDEGTGETCCWIEKDLCSFCAIAAPAAPLVELFNDADANQLIRQYRALKAGA